jgi:hypothetical protein
MNDEEQLEFDRMKTARDSLLITNARLNSKLAERTWVGLTDEQIKTIEEMSLTKNMAIAMTMATLKEKNT